jgi:DNA-binding MarR family transcriptional regulator
MTTPADHADARDGLTLLLGPRQAEIMRLFWTHGQATLRELQQWLSKESNLAYTTIATLCARLVEKGLLRQQIGVSNGTTAAPWPMSTRR